MRFYRDFFDFLPFPLDKKKKIGYTTKTEVARSPVHGGVMVSTGILRYDKRGGQDNPVKMSNFKIKRQQNCCNGCLIDRPSGLSVSGAVALMPPVPPPMTATED